MVFKIFKTVATTEIARWWFIVGYYFCTCVFEISFLEFGYSYDKGKPLSYRIRRIIYVFPMLQFLVIVTNPYHHLFYKTYDFWGDSFGILFYIHSALVYSFVAIGSVYGVSKFKREFREEKLWYKFLVASAIIFPIVLNFLYITKRLQYFIFSIGIPIIFDITPITFVWSILIFVYATFNREFFSLSPIMKHEIVHKLDTSICILGSDYTVLYTNEKFDRVFENEGIEIIDSLLKKMAIDEIKSLKVVKNEMKIGNKNISIFIRKISSLKQTEYLITIKDITSYRQIERKIKEKQNELLNSNLELEKTIEQLKETSKAGARDYVARELHDIIGHSLVVTIKLLEVAKLYINKDKSLAKQSLKDALTSLDLGLANMNAIRVSKKKNRLGKQLETDINKIFESMSKLEIKLTFRLKGLMYTINEQVYNAIKKTCMELVTNALKHSSATEIFILINIKNSKINLLVMDNGKGIKKLVKGNGLTGIEERVRLIGGTIEYNTHEGFMANISI